MNRLKELRVAAGLTQAELASALGYNSVSQISSWENGRDPVPEARIGQIAETLGMSRSKLLGELDDPKDKSAAWREKIARSDEAEGVRFLLMCLPIFEDGGIVSVTYKTFAETIHVDEKRVKEDWPKMIASEFVEVVGDPERGTLRLMY